MRRDGWGDVTYVAILEIVAGLGMIGLWTMLLATRKVPEIPAGDRAIWFHLAAEYLFGAFLATAGVLLLAVGDNGWTRVLAAAAIGGMLYSTVNSSGYYARSRNWAPVAMFAVLTILGVVAVVVLAVA